MLPARLYTGRARHGEGAAKQGSAMGTDSIGSILDWLIRQDPITLLVIALLVRSEVRTGQTVSALKLLDSLHIADEGDSKKTLS